MTQLRTLWRRGSDGQRRRNTTLEEVPCEVAVKGSRAGSVQRIGQGNRCAIERVTDDIQGVMVQGVVIELLRETLL